MRLQNGMTLENDLTVPFLFKKKFLEACICFPKVGSFGYALC